jgi:hypothetical protein
MRRHLIRIGLALTLLSDPTSALAQARDTAPLEEQIDLVQVDRRILAVNGATGRVVEVELEVGERVIRLASRGAVGAVSTTARLLGLTSNSANWQEIRHRLSDRKRPPERILVGERVILVPLTTRIAALGMGSGSWAELEIGPGEELRQLRISDNVALALTQRRAIAFPSASADFAQILLTPNEETETISVQPNSVTLTTSRRVLLFREQGLFWSQLIRKDRY